MPYCGGAAADQRCVEINAIINLLYLPLKDVNETIEGPMGTLLAIKSFGSDGQFRQGAGRFSLEEMEVLLTRLRATMRDLFGSRRRWC